MLKKVLTVSALALATSANAADVDITGTVESKCVVTTDTIGIYGNPTPSKLSTATADGGVMPIVRYDVIQADYYKAMITHPNQFTDSPALNDVVNWTGTTSVAEVSDAAMSAYDTSKMVYNNVTEVQLTIAGSTWFKVESEANYGYDKAFPAGTYRAVVSAECIAL